MTSAVTWASSVDSARRNLRRAGVLKKRSATAIVVPRGRAASSTRWILPPAISSVRAGSFVAGGGFKRDARDGGDGGKRFAAKAESGDGEQIVGGAELRSGVALKGQQGVVAVHAVAVVGDADQLAAAGFDFDANAHGAGVEGVLKQLFDHGRGPIDHFAGGDLVGDLIGKNADLAHKSSG